MNTKRIVWVLLGAVGAAGIGGYLALDRLLAEASTADSLEKLRASKIDLWPSIASVGSRRRSPIAARPSS